MEGGKKEGRKMKERNILRNKAKEGLSDQNFKVSVILIVMYNHSNPKMEKLPWIFQISNRKFTLILHLVSVQRPELILTLCI